MNPYELCVAHQEWRENAHLPAFHRSTRLFYKTSLGMQYVAAHDSHTVSTSPSKIPSMLFEIRIMGRIAVSGVGDQSFQMTDAGYLPFPSYESSNVRVWKKKAAKKCGPVH